MVQHRRVPRPTSDPLKTLSDELAELRKRVAQLENGATSSGAVVRSKAMLVKNGAAIQFEDPTGERMFYLGKLADTYNQPDGTPQTGLMLFRQDGTIAIGIHDPVPTVDGFQQFVGIYDRAGNLIAGDDTTSGVGLAKPWLNIPIYPSRSAAYQATTSASFESLFDAYYFRQHPKVHAYVWVSTDAGTEGEVRLRAGGVTMDVVTCPADTWNIYHLGPQVCPGVFGGDVLVEIQGRRTSGSGSVRVMPSFVRGEQS